MTQLSEDIKNKVLTESVMFLDWVVDHKNKLMTTEDVRNIIKKLLAREGVSYTEDDLYSLSTLTFLVEGKVAKQLRKNFNFDSEISNFYRSINLPVGTF